MAEAADNFGKFLSMVVWLVWLLIWIRILRARTLGKRLAALILAFASTIVTMLVLLS